jgi:uncharacterized protein (TIGR03437 family)
MFAQPPAIDQEGVRNAASRMEPSLPGGSLAPGALFTIDGLRLAASDAKTRVRIAQAGREIESPVISASAERIEASVPMEARAGDAELTVIRGELKSRAFSIRIAPSAFGIFTRNGKGWGPGEIDNEDGRPNSPETPARPGSILSLRGTGWGTAGTAEIYAGGRRARFLSATLDHDQPGVERVRFRLASDTPQGCYVGLVFRNAGNVSNVVTVSIAPTGKACAAEPKASGLIVLTRVKIHARLNAGVPVDFPREIGAAIFPDDRAAAPLNAWELLPPTGTCTGFTGRRSGGATVPWSDDFPTVARPGRDAGPSITVQGPDGTAILRPSARAPDIYMAMVGGGLPLGVSKPLFLDPGHYTVSAAGGGQVGPFRVEADFHLTLKWRAPERLDRIDRARGAVVEWSGTTARERVLVAAIGTDSLSGGTAVCLCMAPGTAGKARLPPLLLANLPATRDTPGIPQNYVFLAALPADAPPPFRARGVETGFLLTVSAYARTVKFQ